MPVGSLLPSAHADHRSERRPERGIRQQGDHLVEVGGADSQSGPGRREGRSPEGGLRRATVQHRRVDEDVDLVDRVTGDNARQEPGPRPPPDQRHRERGRTPTTWRPRATGNSPPPRRRRHPPRGVLRWLPRRSARGARRASAHSACGPSRRSPRGGPGPPAGTPVPAHWAALRGAGRAWCPGRRPRRTLVHPPCRRAMPPWNPRRRQARDSANRDGPADGAGRRTADPRSPRGAGAAPPPRSRHCRTSSGRSPGHSRPMAAGDSARPGCGHPPHSAGRSASNARTEVPAVGVFGGTASGKRTRRGARGIEPDRSMDRRRANA